MESSRHRPTVAGAASPSAHLNVDRLLVDVAGAAYRLGCSERFVRRLVQDRRVPFVKLGGTKVRFMVSDLDEWIESQSVEAKR